MRLSRFFVVMLVLLALPLVLAGLSAAQTFTTLADYGDGFSRFSSLIQGRDSNLYGTVIDDDYGHVLKITPSGTLTVLHNFCPQLDCTDGANPYGSLVLATDGSLYGAAEGGGNTTGSCGNYGCGTIFRMTTGGTVTVLYTFSGSDGMYPDWLIEGSDGNFYGTTALGGSGSCGTVFKLTPAGILTTLHDFTYTDGYSPNGIVQGTDGNLYGTTYGGGKYNSYYCSYEGCGTVFKSTTSGAFTSLHSFRLTDGAVPYAPPVQASDGTFYDTTWEGPSGGDGTIFSITSTGEAKTVYAFTGIANWQVVGPYLASDGKLYGTTVARGGCSDAGFIYSISQTDTFSTVYNGCVGGYTDTVVQLTSGTFYGTYTTDFNGAFYSLDTGLGPFATFVVPAAKVGQTAQILGQGLTGTTAVTFNGVAATKFSLVSDTFMTAVVPSGATTGLVVVTTPGGVLTSKVNFRIIQ